MCSETSPNLDSNIIRKKIDWVVERTIGWMNNFRALSKDYDTDARTGEANILWVSIYYLSRRLTEPPVIKEPWICQEHEKKLAQFA